MLKLLLKHSGKILQLCSNFFLSYIVFLRKTHDKSWEKFQIVGEFAQKNPQKCLREGLLKVKSKEHKRLQDSRPGKKHECGFKIEWQCHISGRTDVVPQQTNGTRTDSPGANTAFMG